MRRLAGVIVLGAALALAACGDGEDESARSALLDYVQAELERSGAPAPVAECIAREFDRRLDVPRLRAAYDKLPENPTDGEVERLLQRTRLKKAVGAAVLLCTRSAVAPE